MSFYKIFEEGFKDAKKNSPLIFTGLACVGVVATSIISIFAGKKLQKKDEVVKQKIEEKKEQGIVVTRKDSLVMHVREKWPAIAAPVAAVGFTLYCTIKSYKESAKAIATLTTTLAVTNKAFDGYKKAAEKLLGDKEKEIEREKMRNDILENPPKKEDEQKFLETQKHQYENNIYNGVGAFFEPLTKQVIYCTESDIVRAFEEMSYRVRSGNDNFIPVSEFLYELSKYAQNDIDFDSSAAQEAGWPYDRCGRHGIDYSHKFDEGVKVGNQYFGKICYKAYWQGSLNEVNYL